VVNGAFAYRVRRIGRARRWKVKKRTGLPETWLTQRRLGLAVKKNLKIEAEKGFRRTLFEPELVDPNLEINFVNDAEAALKSCNVNS
jgi:hypothetical protein